jgi:toxin-antitoxin system PIN domain toxin
VDLCDSNVWLSLALSKHVHHDAARDWLADVEEPRSILFCRATQQSLLRLLTTASVFRPYGNAPLTNRQAWTVCEAFLDDERIVLQKQEPEGLDARWKQLAIRATASPKLWMDAYLAAFALAANYRLVTTDTAFKQFGGLRCELLGNHSE